MEESPAVGDATEETDYFRFADHSPRIVDPLPCRRGVTPFKAVSAATARVAKLLREYPPFVTLPSRFSQMAKARSVS